MEETPLNTRDVPKLISGRPGRSVSGRKHAAGEDRRGRDGKPGSGGDLALRPEGRDHRLNLCVHLGAADPEEPEDVFPRILPRGDPKRVDRAMG